LLLYLVAAGMGVATFRGKRWGPWASTVAFLLFCVNQIAFIRSGLAINREISVVPDDGLALHASELLARRSNYIWCCVVIANLHGIVWSFVGLALQLHALFGRDATEASMLRSNNGRRI